MKNYDDKEKTEKNDRGLFTEEEKKQLRDALTIGNSPCICVGGTRITRY